MSQPGQILIVDPEGMALMATELLVREGYTCVRVQGTDTAIRELSFAQYNLMIVEIHLYGSNLLDLIRYVYQYVADLPLIFFAGDRSLLSLDSAHRISFAFSVEPIRSNSLVDLVKHHIVRRGNLDSSHNAMSTIQDCSDEDDQIDRLKKAIQEAIFVLDSTRTSFRSKRLGSLRQKLEGVLANNPNG